MILKNQTKDVLNNILKNQHGKNSGSDFQNRFTSPLDQWGACTGQHVIRHISLVVGDRFTTSKKPGGKSSKVWQKLTHPHVVTCHPNQNLGRFLDHQLGGFQQNNYCIRAFCGKLAGLAPNSCDNFFTSSSAMCKGEKLPSRWNVWAAGSRWSGWQH